MGISIQEDLEKRLEDEEFAQEYGENIAKAEIAVSVSQARRSRNISQEDLATLLGTSQSYIAKLESGDANPTIGKIGRLLASIGLRMSTNFSPLSSKIEEKGVWVGAVGSNEVSLAWIPTGSGASVAAYPGGISLMNGNDLIVGGLISFEHGAVVTSTAVGSLTGYDIGSEIIFQTTAGDEKGELIVSGGVE